MKTTERERAILARDTTRNDILGLIRAEGECEVAIAAQLALSTINVRQTLQLLEKEGLVRFDDFNKIWFLVPSLQRLEDLKKEIRQITESVRLAFYEIGKRLAEIKEKKLYELDGFLNFEEFVEREFGFKKVYAHYQICASLVFDQIKPAFTNGEQDCIKERQLRPLTKESLTPDDRISIWEQVQSELENLESVGKPAKLSAKLVDKHVMSFQESQIENPPQLPALAAGDYCKVRLRSGHVDSELAKWNGKVVRVKGVGDIAGIYCGGCFGEEIDDYFFREELQLLTDTATAKFTCELSVEQLKQLPRNGSFENSISSLLGNSNVIQFPEKVS